MVRGEDSLPESRPLGFHTCRGRAVAFTPKVTVHKRRAWQVLQIFLASKCRVLPQQFN